MSSGQLVALTGEKVALFGSFRRLSDATRELEFRGHMLRNMSPAEEVRFRINEPGFDDSSFDRVVGSVSDDGSEMVIGNRHGRFYRVDLRKSAVSARWDVKSLEPTLFRERKGEVHVLEEEGVIVAFDGRGRSLARIDWSVRPECDPGVLGWRGGFLISCGRVPNVWHVSLSGSKITEVDLTSHSGSDAISLRKGDILVDEDGNLSTSILEPGSSRTLRISASGAVAKAPAYRMPNGTATRISSVVGGGSGISFAGMDALIGDGSAPMLLSEAEVVARPGFNDVVETQIDGSVILSAVTASGTPTGIHYLETFSDEGLLIEAGLVACIFAPREAGEWEWDTEDDARCLRSAAGFGEGTVLRRMVERNIATRTPNDGEVEAYLFQSGDGAEKTIETPIGAIVVPSQDVPWMTRLECSNETCLGNFGNSDMLQRLRTCPEEGVELVCRVLLIRDWPHVCRGRTGLMRRKSFSARSRGGAD